MMKKYNSKFNTHITKLMQNTIPHVSYQAIRDVGLRIVISILVGERIPCMPGFRRSAGDSEKVGKSQKISHFK